MAGKGSLSFYCGTNYLSEILNKGSVEKKDANIMLTN